MTAERRRPSAATALVFGVAAADAALFALTPYSLATHGLPLLFADGAVLSAIWLIYSRWRPEPALAGVASTALRFLLGTVVTGVFSYLLAGLSQRPLFDAQLAAWDQALGLDWLAYRQTLLSTPALARFTAACYGLLGVELILLILTLDLIGRPQRARELFLGFMITALSAILIGAAFPAAGAFVHYASPEMRSEAYVAQYLGLRNGSIQVFDLLRMEGVVQFPSFHAALALVCSYVVRGTRLFWPLLPVNLLVLLATPPAGGHHFTDVIAGLVVAALVIAGMRKLLPQTLRT
jgi:membrane-associated phospholipid phosphatase